jgi:RimJ/RimL family protein N-acetyltransferase
MNSLDLPERVETERMLLRWATETDAAEIFARYASDPIVTRFLLWPPHQTVDDTRDYLQRKVADLEKLGGANWLMFLKASGSLLGSIGCRRVEPHVLQFGYCLAQDSWGHGYATEATRVMVKIWLEIPAIWRVQAFCDPENVASAKVLERAGLTREGTLRRYVPSPNLDNQLRDAHLYAQVKDR